MIIESKIQTEKYIEGKSFKLYEMQELFDATLYPEICIAKDLDNDCDIKMALLHKPICKGFFSDIIFK